MKRRLVALAIFAAVVSSGTMARTFCSIATDNVNARKGPGSQYDVFFTAGRGYPIRADQILGDWVRFQDWEGDHAWVTRRLVSTTRTAVIVGDDVNVRRDASLRAAAMAKAARGDIYKVLNERNGWVQLGLYDNGKAIGWVREDLTWGGCP